jgi:plasmid maintenance system antidote protein VapI
MKITGVKVIELTEREMNILHGARTILSDLAEQIDTIGADEDFVMELNRAYDTCLEVSRQGVFKYEINDGE